MRIERGKIRYTKKLGVIMSRVKRLAKVDQTISKSLSVFTDTVKSLEKCNEEYLAIHSELISEREELEKEITDINCKIDQNNGMLNKFIQLLNY